MDNMQWPHNPAHLCITSSHAATNGIPTHWHYPNHMQQQENRRASFPLHTTYSSQIPQMSHAPLTPYAQNSRYFLNSAVTQRVPHSPHAPFIPQNTQHNPNALQTPYTPHIAQTPRASNTPQFTYAPRRFSIGQSSVARPQSNSSKTIVQRPSDSLPIRSVNINNPSRNLEVRLCMSESELAHRLRPHIIDRNLLHAYGYPVSSAGLKGCFEFNRVMVGPESKQTDHRVPKTNVGKNQDGTFHFFQTPVSINFQCTNSMAQIFAERQCTRCQRLFHVSRSGEYLNQESCTYHPNKLESCKITRNLQYGCCGQSKNSNGCSNGDAHVWSGTVIGLNGPRNKFVQTRVRPRKPCKVYALDCEMSYTGRGLEVTKISVVNYQGEVAYEHYVCPDSKIVDYNSRFSGITEKDLDPNSGNSIKSLAEVHHDLLQLFTSDTILIGHGLENDLRALRLAHITIVDTSIVFPHSRGYPYKKSLKSLAAEVLKQEIQCGDAGHSCLEDARASLEVMLCKVREETHETNGMAYYSMY